MNVFQMIFAALIIVALATIIVWNSAKIFYTIKTKGENLRQKEDKQINDKGGKEE